MAEDDFDGWEMHDEALGDKIKLIGDDIFVTNRSASPRASKQLPTPS